MEKFTKTNRGWDYLDFTDYNKEGCSLQKSSVATQHCIWLGVNEGNPQILASKVQEGGVGWVKYPIPEDVLLTTRMHLTQEQVKNLLPILKRFVDTGELT